MRDVDVVVIGAGAAGVAAARALDRHAVLVLEARDRIGGRAWTYRRGSLALDLGCGWLHSADENEWVDVAAALGFAIDPTPPPWSRRSHQLNFSAADQDDFADAWDRFDERLAEAARSATTCERALLNRMGGGCQVPIGALAEQIDGRLYLEAVVALPDGTRVLRESGEGDDPVHLGEAVGEALLRRGGDEILRAVYSKTAATPEQP